MRNKAILILSIILVILVANQINKSDWWVWREYKSDCKEEGGQYFFCKGTPFCDYGGGIISVPVIGYGDSYKIGEFGRGANGLDENLFKGAIIDMQQRMEPYPVDPSCLDSR